MAGGGFGRRAIPSCDYVVESPLLPKLLTSKDCVTHPRLFGHEKMTCALVTTALLHLHRAQIAFGPKGEILYGITSVGQSIVQGSPSRRVLMKDGIDGNDR